MANHPQLRADASPTDIWWVCGRWVAPRPPAWELLRCLPKIGPIPVDKVNAMLDGLLVDNPEKMEWADFLTGLHRAGYPDIAGVFRRIDRDLPDRTDGKAFFFWAAANLFEEPDLLREVATGFTRLNVASYDPDALLHLETRLLALGLEDETLKLCEHFLPIRKAGGDLMPYDVPGLATRIIHLRLGRLARHRSEGTIELEKITRDLLTGVPKGIEPEQPRKAAEILLGLAPEQNVTRKDLFCVLPARKKQFRADKFRTWNTLVRAAREAFLLDGAAPGQALCALDLLKEAVGRDLQRGRGLVDNPVRNLADLPAREDLQDFVARASPGKLGIDESGARLLLIAVKMLTRFLGRHQLIDTAVAQTAETEIERVAGSLNQH